MISNIFTDLESLFLQMLVSLIILRNLQAYPFLVNWSVVYDDPMRPLVVDVGSGNYSWLLCLKRSVTSFDSVIKLTCNSFPLL